MLKANYVHIDKYVDQDYLSFELEDTLYYKKFFTTFKGYIGKMKTGVKNSGNTIYNNKFHRIQKVV